MLGRELVASYSQHIQGLLFSPSVAGFRACTPTALATVYHFLSLSAQDQLHPDNKFYQKHLAMCVKRGVAINKLFSVGEQLARKSADDVLAYFTAYNIGNATPCEIGALKIDGIVRATTDPTLLIDEPEVIDLLPSALARFLHLKDGGDAAVVATCHGHTTVILYLKGHYFFVDSAHSKVAATMNAFYSLDDLVAHLVENWKEAASDIDLTAVSMRRDLSYAYRVACDSASDIDVHGVASPHPAN